MEFTTKKDQNIRSSAQAFDPEGAGYDMATARAAGMKRSTVPGENFGHMGTVVPTNQKQQRAHGLPANSYMILKGRASGAPFDSEAARSWRNGVAGEEARGFRVVKRGSRYYSIPK